MDALVMRQNGLNNCCAIMGTSLGYRRIGLLARYCANICLCFDTDANAAGQMGQLKSIADLAALGYGTTFGSISVVDLPEGVDPDEFVTAEGLHSFLGRERVLSPRELETARERYLNLRAASRAKREQQSGRANAKQQARL